MCIRDRAKIVDPDFESFEEWLRYHSNKSVDTEINVQLGEFTLKKHRVEPLPRYVCDMDDFVTIFGEKLAKSFGIQSAEVKNTTARLWRRLVGRRHDVQVWHKDTRQLKSPFMRPFSTLIGAERWVQECIALLGSFEEDRVSITIELSSVGTSGVARLAALVTEPAEEGKPAVVSLKEIVCFRKPLVVHVYDIVEHGRRFHRSLVYSSDENLCLGQAGPEAMSTNGAAALMNPVPPAFSLVIKRNITKSLGLQTYLPSEFLRGLVPQALLDKYVFWQNTDESISGYISNQYRQAHSGGLALDQLHIVLKKGAMADDSGYCTSMASGVITRIPVKSNLRKKASLKKSTDEVDHMLGIGADEVEDYKRPRHKLLSLLYSKPGTHLRKLTEIFMRLDNLSHILVWTKDCLLYTSPSPRDRG